MKAKVMAIGPRRPTIATTPLEKHPLKQFMAFMDRLRSVTVLDPACGSGNFLYIALQALKDLEHEASAWASATIRVGPGAYAMPQQYSQIGPDAVKGIELNLYAAEIARVVIWIGEIQWMLANGYHYRTNPILQPLNNIECRDALLTTDEQGNVVESDWPEATFIVGNPPFLGNRLLRRGLGNAYTENLFRIFGDRLPASSDLVVYWHEKARAMLAAGKVERVGLLATQGIRGPANRRVLERIKQTGDIFEAWSDEPWVLEGANVRVSFLAYDDGSQQEKHLNGEVVSDINTNLTAGLDLTKAKRLAENRGVAFMGDIKNGPFDIPGELARAWLDLPNPDGRSNRDVLRPWANGFDITRRPRDMWIIDFGLDMPMDQAALYEEPFRYVEEHVKPVRLESNAECCRVRWRIQHKRRPEMSKALAGLTRFIATSRVAKHRIFVWIPGNTLLDSAAVAIARDDDYTFGVLQSRVHTTWAHLMGTQLESRPRYTSTTTFETFPFPDPTQEQRTAVAVAAEQLNEHRLGWLNPPGLEPEELEERTLTNLYNAQPAWLVQDHERLDLAVLDGYDCGMGASDSELIELLLKLNLARAAPIQYDPAGKRRVSKDAADAIG
jgi:hypothetical protein